MVYEPRRVTLDGNIFVQFVYHLCGLLFALLVLIAEFLANFNPVGKIFSFLFTNVLMQTRKALLRGKNIFYET